MAAFFGIKSGEDFVCELGVEGCVDFDWRGGVGLLRGFEKEGRLQSSGTLRWQA